MLQKHLIKGGPLPLDLAPKGRLPSPVPLDPASLASSSESDSSERTWVAGKAGPAVPGKKAVLPRINCRRNMLLQHGSQDRGVKDTPRGKNYSTI